MFARVVTSGIVLLAMMGLWFTGAIPAAATHNSTSCKWDFPWPRQVKYWIEQGTSPATEFTAAEATRVSFGPATWSEGNFNLYFTRVSTAAQSDGGNTFIVKGTTTYPYYVAESPHYPVSNCNVDQGHPIIYAYTVFNQNDSFNLDCNTYHSACVTYGQFDLHNTSSHEIGHWFYMLDISDSPQSATMWHSEAAGEYLKRDLDQHDKDTAWIMYGCRGGAACH